MTAYSGHIQVAADAAPVKIPTATVQNIDSKLTTTQPQFPDMQANYQQTVVIPQQEAAKAAQEAQAQQQAVQLTQLVPTVHTGSVEAWRPLVSQYFPASQVEYALAIMRCESGGDQGAVGDRQTAYPSYGLFQIRGLPGRPGPDWLLTPENNVQYAANLWSSSGWQPWSCSHRI